MPKTIETASANRVGLAVKMSNMPHGMLVIFHALSRDYNILTKFVKLFSFVPSS